MSTFESIVDALRAAWVATEPTKTAEQVIAEIQELRERGAALPDYELDAKLDIERDLDYLATQIPVFKRVSLYGLALLAAGVLSESQERALQAYLEHEADAETRANAILAAAGAAIASERERQRNVEEVLAVLEVIGESALRIVGVLAFKALGLPATLLTTNK